MVQNGGQFGQRYVGLIALSFPTFRLGGTGFSNVLIDCSFFFNVWVGKRILDDFNGTYI